MNGTQVGGPTSVTASHALGQSQTFSYWGLTAQTIKVDFINGQTGGTGGSSRDLYVNQISYNGVPETSQVVTLSATGAYSVTVHPTT